MNWQMEREVRTSMFVAEEAFRLYVLDMSPQQNNALESKANWSCFDFSSPAPSRCVLGLDWDLKIGKRAMKTINWYYKLYYYAGILEYKNTK